MVGSSRHQSSEDRELCLFRVAADPLLLRQHMQAIPRCPESHFLNSGLETFLNESRLGRTASRHSVKQRRVRGFVLPEPVRPASLQPEIFIPSNVDVELSVELSCMSSLHREGDNWGECRASGSRSLDAVWPLVLSLLCVAGVVLGFFATG